MGRMPARDTTPSPRGEFLLVTCQAGAEAALTRRQEEVLPGLRRGAWRRGLVTFRLPPGLDPADDFRPDLVFARAVVRSFGQIRGDTMAERVTRALATAGRADWEHAHVWCRDATGSVDAEAIRATLIDAFALPADRGPVAAAGALVLDCIIDEADRWWLGWHRAGDPASTWPGGMRPAAPPPGMVSRAWMKLDEAIAVFGIPLRAGQRALELGAAPGGACQRLLEAGLDVVGVDPALVDPTVAAHPRFRQWRMRAREVRLRACRGFDWILADMNIDPTGTLAALERIVTAPDVGRPGIVATLKLSDWSRAAALPEWLGRFRSWGYEPRCRQLATGGREVCVVAARGRPLTKPRRHATPRQDR